MKERLLYLLRFFGLSIITLMIQKPIFMLYNSNSSTAEYTMGDYINVMWNGLKLDSTLSAYLIVAPFLLTLLSLWINNINLKKILLPYYILISFAMALAWIVDMSLYEFWGFKLDSTILFYLDSPTNAMASVSPWFILLRVVFILLTTALLTWLFNKATPCLSAKTNGSIVNSGIMLLLGGLIFITIRGGVSESTSNIGRAYFSDDQFLNHSAINPALSFLYSMGKAEDFASQFNFFPEDKKTALFSELFPPKKETTTTRLLNTNRPNVLIILLESLGASYIEPLGGTPGITPHINKLSEEGVFFTNFYSSSFRTDRGVLSALSGHPGLPTASIMKIPAKSQTLPSIAKTLAKAGYKTDFLYGGDIDFTNMQSYVRSTGYQRVVSDKDFSLKEQQSNAWGVNDDITFDYLFNELEQRTDSLWHTAFLTLSNHEPFIVPFNRFEDIKMNAAAYTDDVFGQFIEKIKKTSMWDKLLVICLPDHGSRYPDTLTPENPAFFHSPMLWLGGAVEKPAQVDKILSQADVAATLLAQLHLPHDDFKFSRDAFGESYTYPFAFFSFNNGFGFRDSTGVSVYDNNADMIILEEPQPGEERANKGKAILQTLYDDLGER